MGKSAENAQKDIEEDAITPPKEKPQLGTIIYW